MAGRSGCTFDGASLQLFGKVGWSQTSLGAKSHSGLEPFPPPAVHSAEAKGFFVGHLHCCSAGAAIWASSVGTRGAGRFPDFLSTIQLEGEGSCSISHACLAFLDATTINK